jgi:hypothetical protein
VTDPLDGLADNVCAAMAPGVEMMDTASLVPRALPVGVMPQLYMGAIPGATHEARIANLTASIDKIRDAGCVAVVFHGFPGDLPARWPEYVALASSRGLLALAAFGLPGGMDPASAGRAIGSVALRGDCVGVLLDAESHYDHGAQGEARVLVTALREVAPTALVCTQPWAIPTVHAGFPYEEFAAGTDVVCEQRYVNDQHGPRRYAEFMAWADRSWATIERERLAPKGLVRPHAPTFQAEGWDDIPADLAACLAAHPTSVWWCDHGLPPASFLAAVKARPTAPSAR